jgi:hypothetical protein
MNELEHIQKEQGSLRSGGNRPERPYWKRLHHSPFFWVSLVFLLLGMLIFVATDSFVFRPRIHPQATSSGATAP